MEKLNTFKEELEKQRAELVARYEQMLKTKESIENDIKSLEMNLIRLNGALAGLEELHKRELASELTSPLEAAKPPKKEK